MDAEIAEAVAGLAQFDVEDELDLLEQADDVNAASNATNSGNERKKRGIERK